MRGLWARLFGTECEHEHTLVVRSTGVTRVICEACGHVSFKMSPTDVDQPEKLPQVSGL